MPHPLRLKARHVVDRHHPAGTDTRSRRTAPRRHAVAAAGGRAEARPGAKLHRHRGFRLRVHLLDDLSLVHQFEGVPEFRSDRDARLRAAVDVDAAERPTVELVHVDHQHGDLRPAVYRPVAGDRAVAGDPARPEDPRRRPAAADLSLSDGAVLHRDGRRLEMVSRSWASVSSRRCITGAGPASTSTGSRTRTA